MDPGRDHLNIEGMHANGDGPQVQELLIEGPEQLSLMAGGTEPTAATMKLQGGSMAVEGAFEKGDYLTLLIECRVGEVHFVDKVDKHGIVTATERRHVARVERVSRA